MKVFLILFLVVFTQKVSAQSYEDLAFDAYIAYNAKNYKLSLSYFDKVFKIHNKSTYLLKMAAESASLANNKKKAFKYLNILYKKNIWIDTTSLQNDEDFANLHNEKYWIKFIKKVKNRQEKVHQNMIKHFVKSY